MSTLEQDAALQHDALTAAGCWRVFTDHVSTPPPPVRPSGGVPATGT